MSNVYKNKNKITFIKGIRIFKSLFIHIQGSQAFEHYSVCPYLNYKYFKSHNFKYW